jgi:hypothetical protein
MTYKELLQTLADQAAQNYTAYLQSKIDVVLNPSDELLADKTEQYRDSYSRNEKQFTTVLAMVKSDDSLNSEAPEELLGETGK